MKISRIPAGIYAANCYVIMDEKTKESAVIDPGGDADDIIKAIKAMDAKVKYIILTHGHLDHMGGVKELKKLYNVPVGISKHDEEYIEKKEYIYADMGSSWKADFHLKQNDIIKLGNLDIVCIETPGHSPGGMCFSVKDVVFTGDTLFQGSIGRTDLAGGDFDLLIKSIKEKLMSLPESTTVLPGHGPQSNIGTEKVHNPFI